MICKLRNPITLALLHTFTDVLTTNTNLMLNRVGDISFTLPATSPNAALLAENLVADMSTDSGMQLGVFIISNIMNTSAAQSKTITVSGPTLDKELEHETVGDNTISTGASSNSTDITDVMSYHPEWTVEFEGPHLGTEKGTNLVGAGESVLEMLRQAQAQSGEFFTLSRLTALRKIYWFRNSENNMQTFLLQPDMTDTEADPFTSPITKLSISTRSADVVTAINVYGAGLGEDQITTTALPSSLRTTYSALWPDYTINYDTGHILNHTLELTHPHVYRRIKFGSVRPASDSTADQEAAAISLFNAAMAWLEDHKQSTIQYVVDILPKQFTTLLPGSTFYVDYDDGVTTFTKDLVLLESHTTVGADGIARTSCVMAERITAVMDDSTFVASKFSATDQTLRHATAPSTGATTATPYQHHSLLGLEDDDHSIYLPANGARPITGNVEVNTGVTIDGVDLSSHAAASDAHHNWPLLDGDIPGTITRGSELTAHENDSDAHHSWPLLDGDIPGTITRDSELTAHENNSDAHHSWPLLDSDIPATIARDTEITAAIGTHAADADAHHNWPLLDGDIPETIARDSEVAVAIEDHRLVPDAHHQWPLLDENIPSTITRDNELAAHAADANAHHNWPLLDSDIPATIARDTEVTAAIGTHAADENAHHDQQHNIAGTDHTITGSKNQIVGAVGTNALGLITPTENPGASEAILKTDTTGFIHLARLQADSIIGHAIPEQPDTSDLGSFLQHWRRAYISELSNTIFVENTVSAIGGMLVVPHGQGTLPSDVIAAATAINFGQSMTAGDFVELRGNSQLEFIQVGSLVSGTTYNTTRNLDSTGANDWPVGQVFIIRGNSGDGQLLFDAQTAGPRMSLSEQGATYNSQTERVRIGDMSGWGSYSGYGFGAGDPIGNRIAYTPSTGLVIVGDGGSLTNINGDNITTGQIAAARLELTDYLTVSQIGTDIDAARVELETYVQSRGENLITNGSGQIGDLTNFSQFDSYTSVELFAGFGSFLETGYTVNKFNDEYIAIDPTRRYRGSMMVKAVTPDQGHKFYYGVCCFDIDKNAIGASHALYFPGSETTLAADLDPGDTIIELTDSTNWVDNRGDGNHAHSINFYPYTNYQGYTYPAYTYSRLTKLYQWNDGAINRTTHVITLSAPWAGPAYSAGTEVANAYSGGSYNYCFDGNRVTPNDWEESSGYIEGTSAPGTIVSTEFRQGTAFIKLLWLLNRNEVNDGVYINSVVFELDYETSRQQVIDWGHTNDATLIDGGNIYTGSVTADQIAANSITASELSFTPTDSTNIVAEINASDEGLTINTDVLNLTGILQVGDAASDVNAGVTTIDGGQITANTISINQLNFTPVGFDNIVGTINTSSEGITINAALLNLNGVVEIGNSAADVNAGTTTIDGGNITADTITATQINVGTLSSISANIGTITAGTITGTTIQTASSGARVQMNTTALRGYNSSNAVEFEVLTSTGKLTAGGGAVTLDSDGISIESPINLGSPPDYDDGYTISFKDSDNDPIGYMSAWGLLSEFTGFDPWKYLQISCVNGASESSIKFQMEYDLGNSIEYTSSTHYFNGELRSTSNIYADGHIRAAKGLTVGYPTTPADEQIRLYRSSTLMGQLSTADTTWLRINQDVAKNIYTPRAIAAAGGLTASTSILPGAGSIGYTGNLIARRSSTNYTGYIYVPKKPNTLAWNAVTRYGGSTYTLSYSLLGVPSTAKAVLVRWAFVSTSSNYRIRAGYSASNPDDVEGVGVAGVASRHGGMANLSAAGNLYFKSDATSTTNGVWLWCLGYWI